MKLLNMLLLTGALGTFCADETPSKLHFPEPPRTSNHLFYIQRSNNINTVMYEANVGSDKKLDDESPMNVYWIRYADRGQREDLSTLQWQLAYGYKHHSTPSANTYEISLNAFKKRQIWVTYQENKPVAMTHINGRKALLQKVFVQLANNAFIPKVKYVELFGVESDNRTKAYERIDIQ